MQPELFVALREPPRGRGARWDEESRGGVMFLPGKSSTRRVREAEAARRNRAEIVRCWSRGELGRRELMRLGLMTAGGLLAMKRGLHLLAPSAYADVPTGTP